MNSDVYAGRQVAHEWWIVIFSSVIPLHLYKEYLTAVIQNTLVTPDEVLTTELYIHLYSPHNVVAQHKQTKNNKQKETTNEKERE